MQLYLNEDQIQNIQDVVPDILSFKRVDLRMPLMQAIVCYVC